MAEGDATVYTAAKKSLLDGAFDLANDTIKLALVGSGYTPDADTHDFWDDVSGEEASGTGYTAGGQTVTSIATSLDAVNHRGVADAPDVTWVGLDVGTPGYAVLYQDSGDPSTSRLILFWELGATASNGGDYTIRFNAAGVFYIG